MAKANHLFFSDAEENRRKRKRRPKRLRAHTKAELTIEQVLAWADRFFEQNGVWPKAKSGNIRESDGENWSAINIALQKGNRGLPGGSSLPRVLQTNRGVRNRSQLPRLSRTAILKLADEHKKRTGKWPIHSTGPITKAPGETWLAIDQALRRGTRGMRGRLSLAQLLSKYRGKKIQSALLKLTIRKVLRWADAYRKRHGCYPRRNSGVVADAPAETWARIAKALVNGLRGLAGGSSLAQLLAEHREFRNPKALPKLRATDILAWADAHRGRTGLWPTFKSGPIPEAPGETWAGVNAALQKGNRGLRHASSLYKLLRAKRKIPARRIPPGRWNSVS